MNRFFNKALMVIMAAAIAIASIPAASLVTPDYISPMGITAQAAAKTHLKTTKKSIYIGKNYTLKLIDKKGKTISNSKITWKSADKSIATVSSKGVVAGKKAGKVKITATYNKTKYTATITVKSAVSVSTDSVTFSRGSTDRKSVKVTCKDSKGISWKIVEGEGIVKTSQDKKWNNDTKNFNIRPTGKKFGKVKIKIYSLENSKSYAYVNVNVKEPYSLKVSNELSCYVKNYVTDADSGEKTAVSILKIYKVDYSTPDIDTLNAAISFKVETALNDDDNHYIKYKLLDKDGQVVESDVYKSKLLSEGDKVKAKISFTDLDYGTYTIKFYNYSTKMTSSTPDTPDTNKNLTADEALDWYRRASESIKQDGAAGYNKKSWQTIERELQLDKAQFIAGTLTNLIQGFITTEADAETKIIEKGSEDAMTYFPAGDCSKSYIKSVTDDYKNGTHTITIVMKEQVNPSRDDNDGLSRMSKTFLDMKDVKDTIENDSTVSKIVRSADGTITYKDYTIVAKMTEDGKFTEITHYGVGEISGTVSATGVGDVNVTGAVSFSERYTDFVY